MDTTEKPKSFGLTETMTPAAALLRLASAKAMKAAGYG